MESAAYAMWTSDIVKMRTWTYAGPMGVTSLPGRFRKVPDILQNSGLGQVQVCLARLLGAMIGQRKLSCIALSDEGNWRCRAFDDAHPPCALKLSIESNMPNKEYLAQERSS